MQKKISKTHENLKFLNKLFVRKIYMNTKFSFPYMVRIIMTTQIAIITVAINANIRFPEEFKSEQLRISSRNLPRLASFRI